MFQKFTLIVKSINMWNIRIFERITGPQFLTASNAKKAIRRRAVNVNESKPSTKIFFYTNKCTQSVIVSYNVQNVHYLNPAW